jgi:hypothetical protein
MTNIKLLRVVYTSVDLNYPKITLKTLNNFLIVEQFFKRLLEIV